MINISDKHQTWFTSDHHFGHANIIKFCRRPYKDVIHMNEAMVAGWNEVVGLEDTVWVLGDFAMGDKHQTLRYLDRLNGTKHLVAGNHDSCWFKYKKADDWTKTYEEYGFKSVEQRSTIVELEGIVVQVNHLPYMHGQQKFANVAPIDDGGWLVHGHSHERWAQKGRMLNVGVDVTGFRPVSVDQIAERIRSGPANLDLWPGVTPGDEPLTSKRPQTA